MLQLRHSVVHLAITGKRMFACHACSSGIASNLSRYMLFYSRSFRFAAVLVTRDGGYLWYR